MAHYNTHTISFNDNVVKTYSILNLTAQQVFVMSRLVNGKPIPEHSLAVAKDIQKNLNEMAIDLESVFEPK